ncbi:MAG: hypothetical protein ACM3PW_06025 [Chlamydiota bacterium]
MRLVGGFLSFLLTGVMWAAPPQARPARQQPAARATATACEQEWLAMAQRHHEEAQAMLKETSGYRALLVMLRNDAGTVRDNAIRDGLQVNADMWEKLLDSLQRQAASLQALAKQEESQRQALCRSR